MRTGWIGCLVLGFAGLTLTLWPQHVVKADGGKAEKPAASENSKKPPFWDTLNFVNLAGKPPHHAQPGDSPKTIHTRPKRVTGKYPQVTKYKVRPNEEVTIRFGGFFTNGDKAPSGTTFKVEVKGAGKNLGEMSVVKQTETEATIKFAKPSPTKPWPHMGGGKGWGVTLQARAKTGSSRKWYILFEVEGKPIEPKKPEAKPGEKPKPEAKPGEKPKPKKQPKGKGKRVLKKLAPKPTAVLEVTGVPVTVGQVLTLDARKSKAQPGMKLTKYTFSLGDSFSKSTTSPVITVTVTTKMAGEQKARLTATANNGQSSTVTQDVYVNTPPKVVLKLSAGKDDGDLVVDASGTTDAEKNPKGLKYLCNVHGFLPQEIAGGSDTFATLTPGQRYTVTVTVTDAHGGKSSATASITLPEAKSPQPRGVDASGNDLSDPHNYPLVDTSKD